MRAVLLIAVVCVVAVAGVAVGRPALHNKLAHRRARLGEGVAAVAAAVVSKAEIAELERLRVAAGERDGLSLADQFATDVEAHAVAKDALKAAAKAETEATAGLDIALEADAEVDADADVESGAAVDIDVAQAVDAAADETATPAAAKPADAKAKKPEAKAKDSKKPAKPAAKADAKPAAAKATAKPTGKAAAKPAAAKPAAAKPAAAKPAAAKPAAAAAPAAPKVTTLADGTKWSSCLAAPKAGAGAATLTAVALKAAPPMRETSFAVEIDGTYAGPDVTYGSVTMQISRVSSGEPQAVDLPEVVYSHSVVLKDVLMYNPFTAANPLSATMFVPEAAFGRFTPSGEYSMSVEFTNQDKQAFACAKIDFRLA